MKLSRKLKSLRENNPWKLLPVSRRRAKGKSGNSGILPRNKQVEQVGLEMIFNRPNWTKHQR